MRIDKNRPRPASRAIMALLASYTFVWGLVTLGVAASFKIGFSFHEAERLFVILGLLALLVLFLWAFAVSRPWLAWGALIAGGLLMSWAASRLQDFIVHLHAA